MTTTIDAVLEDMPDAPPPLLEVSSLQGVNVSVAQKVVSPQVNTSRNDPALGLLTPAFWTLIEDRAWEFPRLRNESDNDYERRLRRDVSCSVLLTEFADAMGIPAEYARPYLRAIHEHLAALGVHLRERRLTVDGDLTSQYWSVVGKFVSPADRKAATHAKGAAKREIAAAKAAIDKGDKSSETRSKLNNAQRALSEAEAAIAENDAMGTYLPVARHAFAVVIDPSLYK